MRSFQADYVFPVNAPPLEKGILLTEDDGTVIELLPADATIRLQDMGVLLETHKGILVPGFVNTHCHLELSCMKGQISPKKGIAGFVSEFVAKRNSFNDEERKLAIEQAEKEMILNGIVAVGDISNGADTFGLKAKSNLYYHTFIECFDLNPSKTEESFGRALSLRDEWLRLSPGSGKQISVVAHAPYTVTPHLLLKICALARERGSILSFHNQESEAENEMFTVGKGSLMEMYKKMGLDLSWFKVSGQSSLRSVLPCYEGVGKVLLVHNTYTSKEEVQWAEHCSEQMSKAKTNPASSQRIYWATCPGANLYIENRMPEYAFFAGQEHAVTIGTDSLASNGSLSVLEELKLIIEHSPEISLETGMRWATLNGAEFLGIDKQFGSFEKGKKPGVVWITDAGLSKLSSGSSARRLV